MFTGLSRQTTLVSSEGGSVDNIGYKKKTGEEVRGVSNKKKQAIQQGRKRKKEQVWPLFIYSLHLSSVVHIKSPLLLLCT